MDEERKTPIIYCDDLIKTSISGIKEEQIEECVSKIVESNTDTHFNLIQYSKRDRRIYFYTNSLISTKAWVPPKSSPPRIIMTKVDVLEEIKKVLLDEKKEDNSCISIYDRDDIISLTEVIKLARIKKKEYERVKDLYEDKLKVLYSSKEGTSSHIFISDFDFDTNELKIAFTPYSLGEYTYIRFKKENDGDMKGRRESGYRDLDEIMVLCGETISEAYDKLQEFKDFKKQRNRELRPINSRFIIDVDNYGVEIKSSSNVFKLIFRSYSEEDKYECNSQDVISCIKGKEMEFAKKIIVRIEDCPEWMHGNLYSIREKEIKKIKCERERLEKKRQREVEKNMKQQATQEKVKQLKRKIFPFFKNK